MKEFKLLYTKRDKPKKLEEKLEGFSREGWELTGCCGRNNLWIILEREKEEKKEDDNEKKVEEN